MLPQQLVVNAGKAVRVSPFNSNGSGFFFDDDAMTLIAGSGGSAGGSGGGGSCGGSLTLVGLLSALVFCAFSFRRRVYRPG